MYTIILVYRTADDKYQYIRKIMLPFIPTNNNLCLAIPRSKPNTFLFVVIAGVLVFADTYEIQCTFNTTNGTKDFSKEDLLDAGFVEDSKYLGKENA